MEIFFAQLFGVYFVVVGIVTAVRRKSLMPTVRELAATRSTILVLGAVEFAAGLALALTYPMPGLSLTGLLSVIGWMMAVEGLIYIALPSKTVQRYIKSFNKDQWYVTGGTLAVLAGGYLCALGFGLI